MKGKALFFDIDGTLVDYPHGIRSIPEGALEQMHRLRNEGNLLLIATGRPYAMMSEPVFSFPFDGFVSMMGGLVDIKGRTISEVRFGFENAKELIRQLEDIGCQLLFETARECYARPESDELLKFCGLFGFADVVCTDFDMDDVAERLLKIEIAGAPEEMSRKIRETVSGRFGYEIVCSREFGDSFDIFPPGISKAAGIEKAISYLNIRQEDTFAFGDSANDIQMFRFCGTGIAMGNAVQELKDCADITAEPVWDRGLEKILKKL
ncbi:MAG: HAD family hydrolase [Solobacterium sp.]|nr:HAD family hydrolase [Solobacterium sp.]